MQRGRGHARGPNNSINYQRHNGYNGHAYDTTSTKRFWCETCDRDFNSSNLLNQHNLQHQTCNIDGCKFVAHPKVITKHIQMQHSSGLYEKISQLNNPEEIRKWREERKKRFPTKKNIELKIAQSKEKIERGEKMGMLGKNTNFRDQKKDNCSAPHIKHTQNNKHKNRVTHRNKRKEHSRTKLQPEINVGTKLKPFAGIQGLIFESDEDEEIHNDNLTDDELNVDLNADPVLETKLSVCGALSNLINDYGSSDEDTVNVPEQIDTSKSIADDSMKTEVILKNHNSTIGESKSDDDSGPEETKMIKVTPKPLPETPAISKITRVSKTRNCKIPPKRYKPKPHSTLLTKLLANEIRQERNMVLQCVRYIVKNNYFSK